MLLPFKPEPLEELQKRYQRALRDVFDCRKKLPRPRPGELYSHIFDSQDGLRLIISRDRIAGDQVISGDCVRGGIVLHVSASPHLRLVEQYAEGEDVLVKETSRVEFNRLAYGRWVEISGDHRPLTLEGYSNAGVPHFQMFLEAAPDIEV